MPKNRPALGGRLVVLCWAWIVLATPAVTNVSAAERPNIVVIMADDLGFSDLGCYGSEIETPRIDALAKNGVRMTQFYNTAKCHSSRVSLLSGLYCDQAGAESLQHATTFARELKKAGYFTAMAGKWHLEKEPTDQGFDRYFGHLSGATNFFTGDNTFRLNGKPWSDFDETFYTTIANTDYAIQFADEAIDAEQPFLLYVAHNAPHYPLHALRQDYEKYLGRYDVGWAKIRQARYEKQVSLGLFDPNHTPLSQPANHVPAWESLSEEDRVWESHRMSAYAAMVDRLDQEVGRLVDHLSKKQVLDNTLLVFVSDNGACPFERTHGKDLPPYDPKSYWTYDVGWAHVGNTPFRFYKQNSHEGGIASPAILHWPAGMKAKAGSIDTQPGHLIDVMATCLDAAGVEYPDKVDGRPIEPLMGQSLLPIVRGETRPLHPYLYFHFGPNRGLRIGDWKVVSYLGGPWELYNLAENRSETVDQSASEKERLEVMSQKWFEVAKDVDKLPEKQLKPVSKKLMGNGLKFRQ